MFFSACIGESDNYIFFYEEKHPDEIFQVNVYYSDAWSFGSHGIRIFGQLPEQKEVLIWEEEIMNDGANLSKSNIGLEWHDSGVLISLSGQEQETKEKIFILNEGTFHGIDMGR